jgi:hypothetical protein
MIFRVRPALLFGEVSRWEDAVVHRAGFSNAADLLALRLWDKSNNCPSPHTLARECFCHLDEARHTTMSWRAGPAAEVQDAVTKE